ncbi:DEAD/DEAH box helicase [Candidatus Nanohalovita haloferacivicina]|uniref:DEAD/DEAH box helicase n=1 Tax=Candidatus Nanohalovita haloferacivicina TaxID=2978046 RepID=UPI00325FC90C|nr:ERCC4-like helicase [Candidatus Nanohalobia archaeon BNXNv]
MKLLNQEKLESRTYQEVIAASAKDRNTLVVLPTGLGKTVIAAMVASMKLQEGKVLFMAPTRPLVEQHLSTFKDLIQLPEVDMQVMTGSTRPDKRYELWKEKNIFFGTPQVVENDLIANEVPVEDFSLVIFDEAHRATGDYSYNFISEKMRCQRLALTASPGGSKEKIMDVAENLEINNFEVRTEDDPDVEPYIQEKEVNWTKVELNNRFENAKNKMEDAYRTQLKKLKNMGQISSISNVRKTDLLNLRGKISSKLSQSDDSELYAAISHVATALKISQAIELLETQGVSQCYEYIKGLENDDSKAAGRALADDDFQKAKAMVEYLMKKEEEHPKVEKLVNMLEDLGKDEKALIFTEYRNSTEKIVERLSEEGHNATKFIGQQGDEGMSQTQQIETLEEFEAGKYNAVVSTSIGEEGLDIPAVDKVIFYEPVPSAIRSIQRAGRTGRQESGEVHVLIAENTRDEGYYWSAHHKKKNMNKVLQQLKNEDLGQEQQTLQNYNDESKVTKLDDDEEDTDNVKVIADDRENSIAKELSRKNIEVDKQRLDVADFLISEDTAIERKKAEDFVDSMIDQRLFDQIQELQQFANPMIVIEGRNLYNHRDVDPDAIRGAMASVALDYGMPIVWTENEKDTAEMLESMARREQEDKEKDVAVRGTSEGKSRKERMQFVVAGLPGVNTKIAERLLKEFESIQKIFTASEEELKQVEGIGDKKAESIRKMISQSYE